ncbi:unnamed protein product [Leptosia nina]|uniref:Peptidase S1 domain-containing protein n=1 Tax=Leptosia nina TaxID=320188 RepID=A0AAV1JPX7_9NEOP
MYKLFALGVLLSVFYNVHTKDATAVVPYQASVRTDDGHICSGSIISEKWVITVAHTLVDLEKDAKLFVVVGTKLVNGTGQSYPVTDTFVYPKYNATIILKFDIALLKVEEIKFDSNVKAIALPKADTKNNVLLTTYGWKTERDSFQTPYLQEKYQISIPNKDCKRYYGFINDFNLCSNDQANSTTDADFYRDAGGPVVEKGKLAGVVSQFFTYLPGLHARIYRYVSWINKTKSKN